MTVITPEIYRFRFTPAVSMEHARDLVAEAILLAEQIHGPARVRLDCGYFADDRMRSLVLDARTKAGQSVAVLFTQLLLNEFGMSAFDVERVPREDGFPRRGPIGRLVAALGNRCRSVFRRFSRADSPISRSRGGTHARRHHY